MAEACDDEGYWDWVNFIFFCTNTLILASNIWFYYDAGCQGLFAYIIDGGSHPHFGLGRNRPRQ
jgi:hypothetical protein